MALPGFPSGLEGVKQMTAMSCAAFLDLNNMAADLVAKGDEVAFRYIRPGAHQGNFTGIAATGKLATVAGNRHRPDRLGTGQR